jgi:hypothetical protein
MEPLLVQRCNITTAGLGFLEEFVIVHANLPMGRLTIVSALSIPIRENGTVSLLTLTLIMSMQHQNKQASSPPHVYTTTQPQAK